MADDSLVSLTPEVRTLARPVSGVLLSARNEIRRNLALQKIFQQARDEAWPVERFAAALDNILHTRILGSYPEIREASRFLADEYRQFGDGMYIISSRTGHVVYKVTEDDLWQPPAVLRESGNLATPAVRLRPELEGFLVQWAFDESRDEELRQEIQATLPTTDFLAETGDPRLLVATRTGRKTIVEEIRQSLPSILEKIVRGDLGRFLSHFDILVEDPTDTSFVPLVRGTAIARDRLGTQDPKTFNTRYDAKTAMLGRIGAQWVGEIARTLSVAAHQRTISSIRASDINRDPHPYGSTMIMSPQEANWFQKVLPRGFSLPGKLLIVGAQLTELWGAGEDPARRAGYIVLHPDGFDLKSREIHERWEIAARCEYTLWVNWQNVTAYELTDLPIVAEVVR